MNRAIFLLLVAIAALFSLNASAFVPETLTYQGRLTDRAGGPLNDTVDATFRIFAEPTGGDELWSEPAETLDVVDGQLTAVLGQSASLTDVFNGEARWLEIIINGETMTPRAELNTAPYAFRAARAAHAADADALGGLSLTDVLAGQAGAATDLSYDNNASGLAATDVQAALDELAALRGQIEALQSAVTQLQEEAATAVTAADLDALDTRVTANEAEIATTRADVTANTNSLTTLQSSLNTLQTQADQNSTDISGLQDLTQDISREVVDGHPSVLFTGVNVHVRSGQGTTGGFNFELQPIRNGRGNLIVGYNEAPSSGSVIRTGSHNLVVGRGHEYTHFGGVVAGYANEIRGPYANVLGGQRNVAIANHATVTGGEENRASGQYAVVSGGQNNTASGTGASVVGGRDNEAGGAQATISGGDDNRASGFRSSVTGGLRNNADGEGCAVLGGWRNAAGGINTTIAGGYNNSTASFESTVSGGSGNSATHLESTVSGGANRSSTGSRTWRGGSLVEAN